MYAYTHTIHSLSALAPHAHIHTLIHMRIHMHACIHTHTLYMYVCVYACMYVHAYVHAHAHVYEYEYTFSAQEISLRQYILDRAEFVKNKTKTSLSATP